MSELQKRKDMEKYVSRATAIVNKSIAHKGDVRSLDSSVGKARSFEDTISENIWEAYIRDALTEVDAGRWDTAHDTARRIAINSTVITLANQE